MKLPRGIGWEDPKRKVMREVSPWQRMAWRRVSRQWSVGGLDGERMNKEIKEDKWAYNCVRGGGTVLLLWR